MIVADGTLQIIHDNSNIRYIYIIYIYLYNISYYINVIKVSGGFATGTS